MTSFFQVQRICQQCGKEFTAKTTATRYCSHQCNSKAYKLKARGTRIEESNLVTLAKKTEQLDKLKAKDFLTVKDAASLLNTTTRTVYRLIERGRINAVNLSERKTIIRRKDIEGLFELPVPTIADQQGNEGFDEIQDWIKAGRFDIADCYNLTEIKSRYGISESALYDLIKRYGIPKVKKGWFTYVPKSLIDKLLS